MFSRLTYYAWINNQLILKQLKYLPKPVMFRQRLMPSSNWKAELSVQRMQLIIDFYPVELTIKLYIFNVNSPKISVISLTSTKISYLARSQMKTADRLRQWQSFQRWTWAPRCRLERGREFDWEFPRWCPDIPVATVYTNTTAIGSTTVSQFVTAATASLLRQSYHNCH